MASQLGVRPAPHLRVIDVSLPRSERFIAIDLLRGVIMVVMALDHIRDFMTWRTVAPEVLDSHHSFALFFTRSITHFCAPVFFFLAGTGAYLMLGRRSLAEVSHFLWTRGLWLIFLNCTIISFSWTFMPTPMLRQQVILTLGVSMIILAGLIHLPLRWLTPFSLLVIATHNLFDGIRANLLAVPLRQLWLVLHQPGPLPPPDWSFYVLYPIVPWFAVMSLGFCFGAVVKSSPKIRVRYTAWIGALTTALLIIIRGLDRYGNGMDPNMVATGHWHTMSSPLMTVAAFLNTTKYPPSLDYILMTLGPALLALAVFDRLDWGKGWLASKFVVFGRVPMFYYICHLFVVHLVALAIANVFDQPAQHLGWNGGGFSLGKPQPGFGFNLPMIYFAWILSIGILYFPCAWYATYKAQHKENRWLSYL
jgi:uncharacterized membrane protein